MSWKARDGMAPVLRGAEVMAKAKKNSMSGAKLGFEATRWKAAEKLRNNMDAAEYKHVVLGLIFLKYISDAFVEKHNKLLSVRAKLRVTVRRILRKHGYPPDKQDQATIIVLQQAELLSSGWAEAHL